MKIAIPTNDRINVAERSGRASEFAIIEIKNNKIINIDYIENEHETNHHSGKGHNHGEHESDHNHDDLVQLLNGIDFIIGKKFGPHFSRDFYKAGIKMQLTKLKNIDDIISEHLSKKV